MPFARKTSTYTYHPLTAMSMLRASNQAPQLTQWHCNGARLYVVQGWTDLTFTCIMSVFAFQLSRLLASNTCLASSWITPGLLSVKEIISDIRANDVSRCRPIRITQMYFLTPGRPSTAIIGLRKGSLQTSGQMTPPSTVLIRTPFAWETEPQPLQIPFGLSGDP